MPGSAKFVVKLDPAKGAHTLVGRPLCGELVKTSLPRNQFKWLRGICHPHDGAVYCLPCNADSILKITPSTGETTTVGGPFRGVWKWHGGVIVRDGSVICVPANAEQVLRLDVTTGACSLFGSGSGRPTYGRAPNPGPSPGPEPSAAAGSGYGAAGGAGGAAAAVEDPIVGDQKWFGGLLGVDGCVYGIPNGADDVLKIDPEILSVSYLPLPRASAAAAPGGGAGKGIWEPAAP